MILGYIDESGINYKKDSNGLFTDGPYAIWSCVLITEKKYFDIERALQDLAIRYLGKNIKKNELHATDIWKSRQIDTEQDKKVRSYFEELMQLTGKLHIPVIMGIQQKNPNLSKNIRLIKEKELEKAKYSLLTLIENRLAQYNETAVLVSDEEGNDKRSLESLVFQRTKWRYNPPQLKKYRILKPKFLYEFQSNFIIDQLHYVKSQNSLLLQFADHVCFVLRKVLEHLYLLHFPGNSKTRPQSNTTHLPVSEETFALFAEFCEIWYAYYDEQQGDVNMGKLLTPNQVYYDFSKLTQRVFPSQITSQVKIILQQFTPYG